MQIERPKSKQPMPASARRVFEGAIFDVYQWKQKMFDGSYAIFEKLKRPDTVSIIPVTEDKKIIICVQEQPGIKKFFSTLGGRLDKGERPLRAARRELLEETGFKAREWLLLDAVQPLFKIDWAIYTLVARGCKRVSRQSLDSGEKIKLKFVSFDKFIELFLKEDFGDKQIQSKILEAKSDKNQMKKFRKIILG